MANQGSDRRTVLEMLAKAAAASQFPGFSRWAFGQQHQHAADAPAPARTAHYQPSLLFSIRIPYHRRPDRPDHSAGRNSGRARGRRREFIDFMAAHGESRDQATHARRSPVAGCYRPENERRGFRRPLARATDRDSEDPRGSKQFVRSPRRPSLLSPDPPLYGDGLLHQPRRSEGAGLSGPAALQRIARVSAHQRSGTPPSCRAPKV